MKNDIKRSLEQVPDEELKEAVIEMARKLGIPGSSGVYSLYSAVQKEKQKVIDHQAMMDKDLKE